jgi:hypothetical protein
LFYAILDKHRQGYYGKHMLTLLNNSTQVYVKVNKGKYDSLRNEPQIVSFRISIIVEMHYGKIYTIFLSSTLQNWLRSYLYFFQTFKFFWEKNVSVSATVAEHYSWNTTKIGVKHQSINQPAWQASNPNNKIFLSLKPRFIYK